LPDVSRNDRPISNMLYQFHQTVLKISGFVGLRERNIMMQNLEAKKNF